jgi:hypothetical protein
MNRQILLSKRFWQFVWISTLHCIVTVTVNFKMLLLIIGNISLQNKMKLAGKPNFLQLIYIKNNKRNPWKMSASSPIQLNIDHIHNKDESKRKKRRKLRCSFVLFWTYLINLSYFEVKLHLIQLIRWKYPFCCRFDFSKKLLFSFSNWLQNQAIKNTRTFIQKTNLC